MNETTDHLNENLSRINTPSQNLNSPTMVNFNEGGEEEKQEIDEFKIRP